MLNPESLLNYGGLLLLFFVVFGQTGLFFCFFLPSGALMFTAGVWIASGNLHHSVVEVCLLLIVASLCGNSAGYWFGRKAGILLYKREDSTFFRKKHLDAARSFYEKHGPIALAGGLFFPIIRTFAPIVSGMIRLNFVRFILFTLIGSALWISSTVLAGFLVGKIPGIKPYLTWVMIVIILAVTVPIVFRIVKEFKKANSKKNDQANAK